jgi:glycosyltransferase involved in cell wall biosynthesis
MYNGWLVNDCLTCIPNTKTFWHDLLEWIPGLSDMCGGYTDYNNLPNVIENSLRQTRPDYIIRNATFFRRLLPQTKTISLLQDSYNESYLRNNQLDVCNNSTYTVFNSNYVYSLYKNEITSPHKIIPLGVDFDHFRILPNKNELKLKYGIKDNTILYVGSSLNYPKGFDRVLNLINTANYNFCLVMKDDFRWYMIEL